MKKTNFTPNWFFSGLLVMLGLLGMSPVAKADLNPTLTVSGAYVPGGTSVLTIEMTINSTTVEYGSLLTLTLPAGWTGTFTGVGVGTGGCASGTGVVCQQGTNVLIIGDPTCAPDDGCGPWSNGTYQIEIEVSVPPGVSGDQTIDWLLEGDGWACNGACSCGDWTCDMGTLTVNELLCLLDCPADIVVNSEPGVCEAFVNVPNPMVTGTCFTFEPVISEGFDAGTMPAGWAIDDGTGDPVNGYSGQTTDGAMEGSGVFFDASSVPGSFAVNPNFDGNIALLSDDFGGYPGNIGIGYIVSPAVDLTALAGPIYLSFDWQSNTWDDIVGQFGEFTVDVWDGATWVNILTIEEDDLGSVENMDITGYANADFSVRFGYNDEGAWAWGAGIDNFSIIAPAPAVQVFNDYNGTTDASDTYPVGTTTVTFTVNDITNNPVTCSIDVIVTDNEPPVITCPADQVIDLDPGACEAVVNYDVTATDNCGATVSQLAGLPSGSAFPRGVTTNTFEASDDAGNTAQCSFTVTVNEFANPTTQIACNDQVQVSLDENCQAVIGADDILEGGPYGCYDDYIVMVLDATQAPLPSGNVVDGSFIGSTWTVKVVDPDTGNECWGSFTVEDKLAPTIECEDLVINCNADATPGPVVPPGTIVVSSGPQPSFDNDTREIDFNISAPAGAIVKDVNVYLNISHTWVSDLDIYLKGPSGVVVELFTDQGSTGDDVDVTIDDEGDPFMAQPFGTTPRIQGVMQPENYPTEALSAFDFGPVSGTWTVIVRDDASADPTNINDIVLTIEYGGSGPVVADNCGIASIDYVDSEAEGDCGGPASVITRTWTVTDLSGNTTSCVQTITKVRPTLADIEFPADVTVSCDDYAANPSIIAATADGAGVPTIGGIPVEVGDLCDITCTLSDEVTVPICDGTFKVRRKWLCIDWCAGEEQEVIQLVKVLDEQGPDIANPLDPSMLPMQVTATHLDIPSYQASAPSGDPHAICSGHIQVPPAQGLGDNCSSISGWVTELWSADGQTLLQTINTNGGWFWDVELHDNNPLTNGADYIVRYRAFDACGNESSTDLPITVYDKIPPVAVCDEITELAINNSNANGGSCATLFAEDLDDGSYDNCGEVYFLAAKMTGNGASFSQDIYNRCYYPSLEFCCDEVGEQQVILLVLDGDPSPFFTSLNSPSLGCNGTPGLFLTQGWDNLNFNTCMVTVQVTDKIPPVVVCPPNKSISCDEYWDTYEVPYNLIGCDAFADFGSATAYDNCDFTMDYSCAVNLDQCGNGTITRTWVVDDGANTPASCTQTISVYHVSDWYADFPADVTAVCEPGQPAPDFGEPTIHNETCELIAISYEDTYYPVVADACYKIVRTWTVLNWCDDDPFGSAQTGTQVIKVIDNTPPTISGCDDRSFQELDNECGPVFADLSIELSDDCSNLFTVSWEVDLNSDGTVDHSGTDADVAPGTYSGASGDYPLGTHSVTFQVMDQCGNSNACGFTFTITDGKKPTPYCVNGLVLEIMPSTGMVDVWASDFDAGSWDNCPGDLKLSLSPDVNDVQRIYTCDDLGQNTIQLWVTDAAGNQDYCETFVVIQDNMGGCTGGNPSIAGAIATEDDEPAQDVTVEVNGQGNVFNTTMMTAADGLYSIEVPAGGDYTVTPSNDAEPLNGVSTFDLVLISKHILGVQPLDSPYKIIAADANRSNSVTTFDMVEIRKLILHINSNFPNNTSWRFVPKSHQFVDPMNPWAEPLPEVLNFNNVTADILDADFVAIKVGDVNGNAAASNFAASEDRTTVGKLTLVAKDVRVEPGVRVEVPFTAKDFYASGYQFTLEFDRSALEFAGVEAGVANADNFGTALLSEGVLTASWNAADAQRLADNEVVFTLVFTGKAEAQLSDLLSISSRYTKAEAYNENGELLDVELAFTSGKVAAPEFALYQNTPNPFGERTVIGFTLPEAARATLTISDVTGKVLKVIERDFNKGYNEVIISRDELPAAGVLYYQLDTPTDSASRKMILID